MGVFPDIFTEMAVLLLLAAGVGALGVRLRQPLIVAFIAVGILVGPLGAWLGERERPGRSAGQTRHHPVAVRCRTQARPAYHPHHGARGTGDATRPSLLYQHHRLPHCVGLGHGTDCRAVCGGCADLLQQHHHRQAAVRQARGGYAAWPYRPGVQALRERGCRVSSVDYNTELVRSGDPMGHPVLYGDAEDPELIASLPLARVRWVVSTVRDRHVSQALIHTLQTLGFAGRIAVTPYSHVEVAKLEQAGADLVMLPFADAAREAADRLLAQVPLAIRSPDGEHGRGMS